MTNYYWYKANQNTYPRPELPDVKIVGSYFGYAEEPPYKDVEEYDLRFVARCTINELFGKYF